MVVMRKKKNCHCLKPGVRVTVIGAILEIWVCYRGNVQWMEKSTADFSFFPFFFLSKKFTNCKRCGCIVAVITLAMAGHCVVYSRHLIHFLLLEASFIETNHTVYR
jgi:hypothetical protein